MEQRDRGPITREADQGGETSSGGKVRGVKSWKDTQKRTVTRQAQYSEMCTCPGGRGTISVDKAGLSGAGGGGLDSLTKAREWQGFSGGLQARMSPPSRGRLGVCPPKIRV